MDIITVLRHLRNFILALMSVRTDAQSEGYIVACLHGKKSKSLGSSVSNVSRYVPDDRWRLGLRDFCLCLIASEAQNGYPWLLLQV
jgi:hypothetical protein